MRVIVVEDEVLIAFGLRRVLEDAGHEVPAIATTVEEGLAAVEAHRPDVLTIDINLGPGGDGIDVAIAAFERHGIRSVVVSGNVDVAARERSEGIKPLAYLAKPFSVPALLACLRPSE